MAIDWSKVESPLERQYRLADELIAGAARLILNECEKNPDYVLIRGYVNETRRLRNGLSED